MPETLIQSAIQRYLDETKPFLKSHGSVSSVLRKFSAMAPVKPLAELKAPDIHDYIQNRLKAGIRPSTLNRELAVISATVNHAIRRWGFSISNPVRYQWLKGSPLRVRYLTRTESINLIHVSASLRPDLAYFVTLALHTGCRKGELLTLRWSDVNLQRAFILLRPEQTKSARHRAIPLNKTALQAFHALLEANQQSQWVFAKKNGERVKTFDWLFRKALRLAGIQDFRIHDLRHTFASWLVSEGVELIKVRDLLGHSSIKMTERYSHLMPDRLHTAVQVLDVFA